MPEGLRAFLRFCAPRSEHQRGLEKTVLFSYLALDFGPSCPSVRLHCSSCSKLSFRLLVSTAADADADADVDSRRCFFWIAQTRPCRWVTSVAEQQAGNRVRTNGIWSDRGFGRAVRHLDVFKLRVTLQPSPWTGDCVVYLSFSSLRTGASNKMLVLSGGFGLCPNTICWVMCKKHHLVPAPVSQSRKSPTTTRRTGTPSRHMVSQGTKKNYNRTVDERTDR